MPRIEAARPADAALLFSLRRDREEWMAHESIDQWEPNSRSLRWFQQSAQHDEWWVVRQDDMLAAAVRVAWRDPLWAERDVKAVYVHDLMVSSRATETGLGKRLIQHVENQASHRGVTLARLDCMEANEKLVAYYQRQGFAVVGRTADPYPHRGGWAWGALIEKSIG